MLNLWRIRNANSCTNNRFKFKINRWFVCVGQIWDVCLFKFKVKRNFTSFLSVSFSILSLLSSTHSFRLSKNLILLSKLIWILLFFVRGILNQNYLHSQNKTYPISPQQNRDGQGGKYCRWLYIFVTYIHKI